MVKLCAFFLLAFYQTAQAAVIFGDGDPLTPITITEKQPYLQNAGCLHLMTSTEAKNSLHKQLSDQLYNPGDMWNNLQMTAIPQTTWDLFVLLQWWKHIYPTDQPSINVQEQRCRLPGCKIDVKLNNAFIQLICDNGLSTAFIQRDFGVITEKLVTYIYDHLFACNEIEKAYSEDREFTSSKYNFSQAALIFFFKDIYPEIPHLLKALTIIEEECLKQDKLPLWRHSYEVQPAPLVRVENTVHSRTRSFSYSFLSCMINDGTFDHIGSYKGKISACTFSYYAQMLRDRAFVKKGKSKFPYYIPGQLMKSEEEIKEVLASIHDDNITCTLLDKSQLNHDVWYLPKVFANNVIWLSGEECHPRLKGTCLSPNEAIKQDRHMGVNIFQTTIPAKTSAKIFQNSPVIWVTHEGVLLSSENRELIARLEEQRLLEVVADKALHIRSLIPSETLMRTLTNNSQENIIQKNH